MIDGPDSLSALLASGLAVCSTRVADGGGVIGTLFLTGLLGSLSHCSGMCGPFVLSQVASRLESVPASRMTEWRRLAGAALVPYHLGRATTYALLGALGALAAGRLPGLRWLAAVLLGAAALFLLALAVPALKRLGAGGGDWWSGRIGRLAQPLFHRPTGARGWLLGVALGFIPCGLLYAALAVAAASGDPVTGALGMLAFAAGTVPMLVTVGAVGHAAVVHWRAPLLKWAPLLLVLNAGVLGWMAWRMLA
ncbi:MAG: sulfite exporter TauE/SafE family protein [Actinomycetota bacterium]